MSSNKSGPWVLMQNTGAPVQMTMVVCTFPAAGLTEEEANDRYTDSGIKQCKLSGLLRPAVIRGVPGLVMAAPEAPVIRAAVREFERDRWMMLSGEHLPCKGPGALMLERTPAGLRAVKNKYLLASIARAQLENAA